jgi:hypothetical protein
MLIKTHGRKKERLYMLYRYEFVDLISHGGANKYRWLREMVEVPIQSSLALTASLMPSYWAKNEHILSIEVRMKNSMDSFCCYYVS